MNNINSFKLTALSLICASQLMTSCLHGIYQPKAPFWYTATKVSGCAFLSSASLWMYAQAKIFIKVMHDEQTQEFFEAAGEKDKGNHEPMKQFKKQLAKKTRPYTMLASAASYSALFSLGTLIISLFTYDRASFRDDVYAHIASHPGSG